MLQHLFTLKRISWSGIGSQSKVVSFRFGSSAGVGIAASRFAYLRCSRISDVVVVSLVPAIGTRVRMYQSKRTFEVTNSVLNQGLGTLGMNISCWSYRLDRLWEQKCKRKDFRVVAMNGEVEEKLEFVCRCTLWLVSTGQRYAIYIHTRDKATSSRIRKALCSAALRLHAVALLAENVSSSHRRKNAWNQNGVENGLFSPLPDSFNFFRD